MLRRLSRGARESSATLRLCMLAALTWLPFSVSPFFRTTRPLRLAPCARSQSFLLSCQLPSQHHAYVPLRCLPCRSLAPSILLRLIAVQNGFVLIQEHPRALSSHRCTYPCSQSNVLLNSKVYMIWLV